MPKEQTQVNWRASKGEFAGFVRGLYNRLVAENHSFYNEAGAGDNIDGLIYDFGHPGRGMDDFPYAISLEIPGAREVASRWKGGKPSLEVEISVSDLVSQLKSQVRPYLEQHPYRRNHPQAFEAELKTLEVIERRTSGGIARVNLSFHHEQGGYRINSIELVQWEKKKNRES